MKHKSPSPYQPLQIAWRWHYEPNEIRVWRTDWPSDVFEIWTKEEFDDFQAKATRFGIKFEQAED